MSNQRRLWRVGFTGVRVVAGAVAVVRLARAARTEPPVRPTLTPLDTIDVVVPARDEEHRIGPLLAAIVGAPGVGDVIVVDDQSSDGTAALAIDAGARVVSGTAPPPGWAGKAWALQQGFRAASGEWVVTLDADTRPHPLLPTALVARARAEQFDLLTVAGRFDCPTGPSRWLHAAMLTTLVYRFSPPGSKSSPPRRTMANGQCMTVRRRPFLADGGMAVVAGAVVEDLALARALAVDGRQVAFLDASELLTVRMFDSFASTWHGWGRSLALPGVVTPRHQLVDVAVVVLAQVLPLPRLLTRRGDVIDVALSLARLGTLAGTRRSYLDGGIGYWLSPLADPLAAAAIALGIGRRSHVWRGRRYDRPGNPGPEASTAAVGQVPQNVR